MLVEEMVDHSFEFLRFFPLATEEALQENLSWMTPGHYDAASKRLLLSMHSWLLDTGKHKILIDGCVGNDKNRPGRPDWCGLNTPFLDRLAAAGATPDEIDFVLCTHLIEDLLPLVRPRFHRERDPVQLCMHSFQCTSRLLTLAA